MSDWSDIFGIIRVPSCIYLIRRPQAVVGSVEDLAPDRFQEQVSLNFMGAIHVTKAAIPIFRKQGQGRSHPSLIHW
jgi:NAD(P)-dependent dehydrogenase (short-subunit alcohol dehydrogenase family)